MGEGMAQPNWVRDFFHLEIKPDQTIKFRLIEKSDTEQIREWRNSQMEVLRQNRAISESEQMQYFHKRVWPQIYLEKPEQVIFTFEVDNEVLGYGGIVHVSWEDLRAEVSFLLNPEIENNSTLKATIFGEFCGFISDLAFKGLLLEKLTAETFSGRKDHISMMELSGFIREGRLVNHVLKDGKRQDSIIHALFPRTLQPENSEPVQS
jgi:RimJ/RimL family protein N-acetyltransferase